MPSMIIHDRRLHGKTPTRYNYVMQINEQTSLRHIIGTVAHYGRMKKLSPLHILCHGYEANWNLGAQMCVPAAHGGFGLQLGRDNLTLFNVTQTAAWKNLVDTIVVFACAPADTGPGNAGTYADGKRFMGELALWTGAHVIAARDTQIYNDASGRTTIDFGAWEGPVYDFSNATPDGQTISNPSTYHVLG
jgi:hypothetical protein